MKLLLEVDVVDGADTHHSGCYKCPLFDHDEDECQALHVKGILCGLTLDSYFKIKSVQLVER